MSIGLEVDGYFLRFGWWSGLHRQPENRFGGARLTGVDHYFIRSRGV
jgi:hypothetical protein